MTHCKKLIEVALPLEAISEASAYEKMPGIGAHPRGLHLWWARRPYSTARAVIFASLVDDPDQPDANPKFVEACRNLTKGTNAKLSDTPRMRLYDFLETLSDWKQSSNVDILNTARDLIAIATDGNPPPLLDPFAGGGSIPLEAQRLGLEAHASDLNPVAVMINKAQIEIPPRFANMPPVNPRDREQIGKETWRGAAGLAADVRYYGEWMREKAWERIGHLYPKYSTGDPAGRSNDGETVIAWLWARTVKSPNPAVNAHVPLVRSFILSKKKGRERWAKPIIEVAAGRGDPPDRPCTHTIRFEVTPGKPPKDAEGTVGKQYGGGRCLISGEPIPFEYIREEGKAGRMGAMLMAIVTEGQGGRSYYSPDEWHEKTASEAEHMAYYKPAGEMPLKHRNFQTPGYGMYEYGDLFTPRQLVALTTFSDLVHEAREQAHADALAAGLPDDGLPLRDGGRGALAYAEAVSVYLAFAVDRTADFGNTIVRWASSNEKAMNLFARQAIPMTWDFAETNVIENVVGGYITAVNYIADCINTLPSNRDGKAIQDDAATGLSHHSQILVSTDPPYYDNIGYADLSDFFYIWMRKSLRDVYPDIFGTMLVPKEPELIASPHRHGSREKANQHFETGMTQTFRNIRQRITPDYPLTVYYAFKQQDSDVIESDDDQEDNDTVTSTGWETMLSGLIESGFSIIGTWPMRSEQKHRIISHGTNALASSIVLVCRPRSDDAPTISRRQFVDALRRELPTALQAMQSGNIAPVDLAQASIGPGMAIYSRYSKVLEADGSPMSVRTALGLINAALDEYLTEQDGDIDPDTRFAVDWFTQFGFNEGEFGQADVLARAKNTSVAGVEAAGLVVSGRGKVKLKHWSEYDPGAWDPTQDKRPTVWEATHHLIERLNSHGETGSAMLMTKIPHDMAAEARNLAYRLYSICERKGWADHARDYNALVISWAGIGEEAARLREAAQSGTAANQPRLFD